MVDLAKLRKQAKQGQKAKAKPAKAGSASSASVGGDVADKALTKKPSAIEPTISEPVPQSPEAEEIQVKSDAVSDEMPSGAAEESSIVKPAPKRKKAKPQQKSQDSSDIPVGEKENNPEQPAQTDELVEYLVFNLGEELYGISIEDIVEIVPYRPSTTVPKTPGFVEGIISLRGKIILVMDVRQRLGLPPFVVKDQNIDEEIEDRRIIIFEIQEDSMSIIVDHISQVVRIDREEVQQVGDLFTDLDSSFACGALEHKGRLVALLDLDGLFSWGQE